MIKEFLFFIDKPVHKHKLDILENAALSVLFYNCFDAICFTSAINIRIHFAYVSVEKDKNR